MFENSDLTAFKNISDDGVISSDFPTKSSGKIHKELLILVDIRC